MTGLVSIRGNSVTVSRFRGKTVDLATLVTVNIIDLLNNISAEMATFMKNHQYYDNNNIISVHCLR